MGESAREKRVQDKCRESDRAGEYSGRLQSTRMPPAHEKISGVCSAPAANRAEFKHMYMHACIAGALAAAAMQLLTGRPIILCARTFVSIMGKSSPQRA